MFSEKPVVCLKKLSANGKQHEAKFWKKQIVTFKNAASFVKQSQFLKNKE